MQLQSLGANKTQVDLADGTSVFFSYKTPVAALVPGKGWIRTSTKYSSTTSKHINQWITGTATEVDQWDIDQIVAFWELAQRGWHSINPHPILITSATNPMDYDTETLWHEINDMPGEIYDIIDEEEEDGFSVLNFQEALKGDNDF